VSDGVSVVMVTRKPELNWRQGGGAMCRAAVRASGKQLAKWVGILEHMGIYQTHSTCLLHGLLRASNYARAADIEVYCDGL
jgi:hypothetical protein